MPRKITYSETDKRVIVEAVIDRIEDIAVAAFGEKNKAMSSGRELRFGSKGSKAVQLIGERRGSWFDHEADEGGGPLDLLKHHPGFSGDPYTFASHLFSLSVEDAPHTPPKEKPKPNGQRNTHAEKTDAEKLDQVLTLIKSAKPLQGTWGEKYLAGRGISRMPGAEHFVFGKEPWSDYPCLVAIVRDRGGEIVGCQKIYLEKDKKAPIDIQKRTSGRTKYGCVKLEGEGPPAFCEGPETGLSIWQATGRETWILTGSLGQIRNLQLNAEDTPELTIARDGDKPGSPADKALHKTVRELEAEGFSVLVAAPPVGQDFNDILQRRGDHAVQENIAAAMPLVLRGADLDTELSKLGNSDFDNAMRFRARYPDECLWNGKFGWHDWDGKRFVADRGQRTVRKMHKVAQAIMNEIQHIPPDKSDDRKYRAGWAIKSLNTREIRNALTSAEPYCYAREDSFDSDPFLLNCRNGTVDLRNGGFRKHDKADRITKLAPVDYDPDATCETWMEFLASVLGVSLDQEPDPDDDPLEGIQRAIGYSLCGDMREKKFYILYGPNGNNGKSVFLNLIQNLMGDYAMATSADTFMMNDGGNGGINNDVARLRGARFVAASETDKSRRLSENFIKQVTGRDVITARFLRREFFEFRPEFKVWLASNHKPEIRGTDDALWMRPLLIPFLQKFWAYDDPDRPVHAPVADPNLEAKLKVELPGILTWAVKGCVAWQQSGLKTPKRWIMATKEYRSEMDIIGTFLDECCELSENATVDVSDLYEAYSQWCDDSGHRALAKRSLGMQLNERGFAQEKGSKGSRRRRGLTLKHQLGDMNQGGNIVAYS